MQTLKDFSYTMTSCTHCGICKHILGPKARDARFTEVCPIFARYNFDAYSGQGLVHIAQEIMEGKLEFDDGLVEALYQCTTCGACDINCKTNMDMEVLETIMALRAKCVEDGKGPMSKHKDVAQSISTCHNAYGRPHEKRTEWLPKDVKISANVETVYFVGCTSSYVLPKLAQATAKVLSAAGQSFAILGGEEWCCGLPLWRTGQQEAAAKVMKHNIEALKKCGAKRVVMSCAECYGTFKGDYPRIAQLDFEVLHVTELIAKLIEEGALKLKKKLNMKVTYHDPCLLGRLSEQYVPWEGIIEKTHKLGLHNPPKSWRRGTNGVYDAPREVLRAIPGVELVEMYRNEENAFCCGGGGGVLAAFPDFAKWTAAKRLEEVKAIDVKELVSSCPFCALNFNAAIRFEKESIGYHDIIELVSQAL
jgi:Fe-S oxidoreductase